jgi:peptidoglycan/xylan/chitin deacetylase (PgdA/CDA1 family)
MSRPSRSGIRLRILAYHRIADPIGGSEANPMLVSASPADFARQMRHLAVSYRVLSITEVLDAIRLKRMLPERATLITFDDAYSDFSESAWPILRKYRLPVTVFVATTHAADPNRRFWWDRLYQAFLHSPKTSVCLPGTGWVKFNSEVNRVKALRHVQCHIKDLPHGRAMELIDQICGHLDVPLLETAGGTMSWATLRELARDGVTIAPHTRTHPALTQLSIEEARREVRGAREDIESEIGSAPPVFCYPFGIYNDQIKRMVREEGFEMAVTCEPGQSVIPGADPLQLSRISITRKTTPWLFKLRLQRATSVVVRWRHQLEGRIHRRPHSNNGNILGVDDHAAVDSAHGLGRPPSSGATVL